MYEVKYRELQDTVTQLAKVPDDEFIKPMYESAPMWPTQTTLNIAKRVNQPW